jgi:hypothetical protein
LGEAALRYTFPILSLLAVLGAAASSNFASAAVLRPPPELPKLEEEVTLESLLAPDRFAWPARFTCRFDLSSSQPVSMVGSSPADLNRKLVILKITVEQCRGGFTIRSLQPQEGKLDEIIGEAATPAAR